MSKRLKTLSFALVCALGAGPAIAEDTKTDHNTVVATVNGTDITLGHVHVLYSRLPEQYRRTPMERLLPGIIDQLVDQTLLAGKQPAEGTLRTQITLENERRALLANQELEAMLDERLTEDLIKAEYDRTYGNIEAGDEYNASHILVETEEEAKALVTELEGGADFATLAREKSTGPSGPGGGELGWFGTGRMVPEFEQAVVALEKGAVSEPVKTQFGWHVVKLNDKRPVKGPTLDQVRSEIRNSLGQQVLAEYLAELRKGATVDMSGSEGLDPQILNTVTLD